MCALKTGRERESAQRSAETRVIENLFLILCVFSGVGIVGALLCVVAAGARAGEFSVVALLIGSMWGIIAAVIVALVTVPRLDRDRLEAQLASIFGLAFISALPVALLGGFGGLLPAWACAIAGGFLGFGLSRRRRRQDDR